jgi:DNA polymerase III delta prime subunit
VGQDEAVQAVVDLYQVFRAGLNSPGRPVGNLLFLGPTGAGKTRVVEATAEVLFGDPRAVIKVDCAEFQHSHEIAKLIGSPPGYLGHRETHPLITQEALAQYHTEKLKISFCCSTKSKRRPTRCGNCCWDSGQGDAHARRQPPRGFVADDDLHDVEPGRRRNHRADDRRMGFAPRFRGCRPRLDEKVEKTATGSGQAEIRAGVHEPHRQDGGVSSAAFRNSSNKFWRSSWGWCSSACWKRRRAASCSA